MNLFPASKMAAPPVGPRGDPSDVATYIIPIRKALWSGDEISAINENWLRYQTGYPPMRDTGISERIVYSFGHRINTELRILMIMPMSVAPKYAYIKRFLPNMSAQAPM